MKSPPSKNVEGLANFSGSDAKNANRRDNNIQRQVIEVNELTPPEMTREDEIWDCIVSKA